MNQTEYNNLKQKLVIDPMRLTEELMELPAYQQQSSEGAADAQRARDEAKDSLELMRALAADVIRETSASEYSRKSVDQIKAEVALTDDVIAAEKTLRDAEYNLNLWKSLADGMRSKSYAIGKIADLIQSGYTTPNSIYSERRTMIDKERKRQRGDE